MANQVNILMINQTLYYELQGKITYYRLEPGIVVDGFIRDEHAFCNVLIGLSASWKQVDHINFIVYSKHFFRWLCKLPKASDKEIRQMLNHQQALWASLESNRYKLYYATQNSEQQCHVGIVGVPYTMSAGYEQVGQTLKVRRVSVTPYEEWCGKCLEIPTDTDSIQLYQVGHQKIGISMLVDGLCTRVQESGYEQVGNHVHDMLQARKHKVQLILWECMTDTSLKEWGSTFKGESIDVRHVPISLVLMKGWTPIGRVMDHGAYGQKIGWTRFLRMIMPLSVVLLIGSVMVYGYVAYNIAKSEQILSQHLQTPRYQEQLQQHAVLTENKEIAEVQVRYREAIAVDNQVFDGAWQEIQQVVRRMQTVVTGYSVDSQGSMIAGYAENSHRLVPYVKSIERVLEDKEVQWEIDETNRLIPTSFRLVWGIEDEVNE